MKLILILFILFILSSCSLAEQSMKCIVYENDNLSCIVTDDINNTAINTVVWNNQSFDNTNSTYMIVKKHYIYYH